MKTTHTKPQWAFTDLVLAALNLTLASTLSLTTSCNKRTQIAALAPLDSKVVASVQGNVIREESYRQKLRERIGRSGFQPSAAEKEAALEEMIRYEAVYAQAKAAKFDEQPAITVLIRNLITSRFIEQQIGTAETKITNEEISDCYRIHGTEFVTQAAARGAIIFLRAGAKMMPEKREELKLQAQLVLAEAQQTRNEADFTRLVQRHSEDQATRYRGGDLGWLTRVQCDAAFGAEVSAALFALNEPNSFAPLLETSDGFYILKLRERQEAQQRPLAEVQELIRYRLLREHQFQREKNFYARMKQGLDVQINRPLLESISIPLPHQDPPGLPSSGMAPKLATR
jgi:parvulin-like peptidyl-prolyl isomerase